MNRKSNSVKLQINRMQAMVIIPVVLVIGALLSMMSWQNEQYRHIIRNLTMATEFNFDFKSNIDYKMYRIVIGADTFEDINPYDDIENSRKVFLQLLNSSTQESSKKGLSGLLILIDILEERIKEIESSNIFGEYDINMRRLDLDIYIITDLIEESMSDYIYNETKNLEAVRETLDLQVRRSIIVSILVSIFLLLFLAAFFSIFSKKITDPIEQLCSHTKELASGNLDAKAPESKITELQMLSERYDQMVTQIKELIDHIREEQEQQRQTELKLLQAQINPHFLYNTLDAIVWLAEGKRHDEVVLMITALSSFLRISLSKGSDFITIRDEVEHIRSYLAIQHFRYEDILDYEIDIDDEIKEYYILKLTLQPIVENALYHGLKNKREPGLLLITGYRKNRDIILEVRDNGIGMKPDKLEKMRMIINGKGTWDTSTEGFGIANVAERIRLNYGERYIMEIESEHGKGTVVTVRIPT